MIITETSLPRALSKYLRHSPLETKTSEPTEFVRDFRNSFIGVTFTGGSTIFHIPLSSTVLLKHVKTKTRAHKTKLYLCNRITHNVGVSEQHAEGNICAKQQHGDYCI